MYYNYLILDSNNNNNDICVVFGPAVVSAIFVGGMDRLSLPFELQTTLSG